MRAVSRTSLLRWFPALGLGWMLSLSGCCVYRLVEPVRTTVGGLYTVDPQIAWSAASEKNAVVWTVDGPNLQALRFVSPLRDGDVLFGEGEDDPPHYREDMTSEAILGLVAESASTLGLAEVEGHDLEPAPFGSREGFRFQIAFTTSSGLEGRGLVAGAVAEGRLYLIIYAGVAHYYSRYREEIERIIASIEF